MSRSLVFLRVSTEEQARGGISLAAQEERGRAFAASQGGPALVFADSTVGPAKDMERPGLHTLSLPSTLIAYSANLC